MGSFGKKRFCRRTRDGCDFCLAIVVRSHCQYSTNVRSSQEERGHTNLEGPRHAPLHLTATMPPSASVSTPFVRYLAELWTLRIRRCLGHCCSRLLFFEKVQHSVVELLGLIEGRRLVNQLEPLWYLLA